MIKFKNAKNNLESVGAQVKTFPSAEEKGYQTFYQQSNLIGDDDINRYLGLGNETEPKGNEILKQEVTKFFGDKSYLSNSKDAVEIINLANTLNKMINNPNRITNDDAGKIFERALARVNFIEQYGKDIIFDDDNKSLDLTNYHFGSKPVERGSGNLINFTITIKITKQKNCHQN